ncbi:unnamed protein product [Cylindrotheca closterium]|uniref:DDE Tnp4 domain-containing protein n=2 Tax=Cylindrotheca closterium TaxID=2856 RepID=A0AAD2G128_9STRA|nr:unnamed protein product [Cylindrotheca closterium]
MLDFDLDDDYDTALFFALAHLTQQQTRRPKYPTERVNWDEHLQKELYQNSFHRTYCMSYPSFMKLKGLLGDKIVLNGARSTASSGTAPIIPQVVMACGICWLAGGSPTDIKNAYGLTVSTVYRLRDLLLDAVCTTDELDIRLPDLSNPSEISKFRADFEKLSSSGVCKGCVGVLDGMLQRIGNPSVACAEGQVRSYFSGHYNCPGLNVLAMCDAFLRFTFFGVLNPGSASDRMTYLKSRLPAFVDSLPFGTYVIGDAAFPLGDNLLIPFTGTYKLDPSNDVYNFHISQLRIRIEMAFGHLNNKWRVLRRPLGGKLATQSQVLEVCARLHNFGINERILGGVMTLE